MASIRLTIPAESRYLRIARLTAAGVATDLGFDLESIEDLRVAVDEACALLLGGPEDAELQLSYSPDGDSMVIEGRSPARPGEAVEIHPVARELLELTADEYDVTGDEHGRRFRLVKQRRNQQG
jgi:serine/threonine-protein kinase RsbW